MRDDTSDYRQLFLNDVPLMDVRAPVEFVQGAFPTATNIPLLDDQQREQIGIRYKDAGQEEAIRLGLELATPDIQKQRLEAWTSFCNKYPQGYLYCFRGGLRSRTTQQWLQQQGVEYPLVRGGYKAMRRFLIDELEQSTREVPLVCVSGLTGVGKPGYCVKSGITSILKVLPITVAQPLEAMPSTSNRRSSTGKTRSQSSLSSIMINFRASRFLSRTKGDA